MMLALIILITLVAGFFVLLSFIGAFLWNISIVYMFNLPTVEWYHILALIILLYILLPNRIFSRSGSDD